MQSPPFPRCLVPPRSKYSPQHHVLKHPQLPFLPQCQRPSFTPIQNNRQNYSLIYIVINIKNSATCFRSKEPSSGQIYKRQYWYIQRVPTVCTLSACRCTHSEFTRLRAKAVPLQVWSVFLYTFIFK